MQSPLKDIRVLDFSIAFSGPLCASMLGDMGAEVIKIEEIRGESIRRGRIAAMDALDQVEDEESLDDAKWLAMNRSKKSLAIDIRCEKGKEIAFKLIKDADVFLECFRPGVMDRLGYGYEMISDINPRIVYCSLSGFGEKGPLARRIGADLWTQAMAGVVSYQGTSKGPPYASSIAFIDQGGAGILAFGIMVALFVRERTGIGQHLSSSLLHAALHMQSAEVSSYLVDGQLTTKVGRGQGRFPHGAYQCKDGDVVTIFGEGPQWSTLCKLLGLEHLITNPLYNTDEKRYQRREELYPILDEGFRKKTRAEWQQLFREAKMRCDPCLNYHELFSHPQIEANEMVITLEHPIRGAIRQVAAPTRLERTPANPSRPPPLLGQHTVEILTELDYSSEDIDKLENMGVIKTRRAKKK